MPTPPPADPRPEAVAAPRGQPEGAPSPAALRTAIAFFKEARSQRIERLWRERGLAAEVQDHPDVVAMSGAIRELLFLAASWDGQGEVAELRAAAAAQARAVREKGPLTWRPG